MRADDKLLSNHFFFHFFLSVFAAHCLLSWFVLRLTHILWAPFAFRQSKKGKPNRHKSEIKSVGVPKLPPFSLRVVNGGVVAGRTSWRTAGRRLRRWCECQSFASTARGRWRWAQCVEPSGYLLGPDPGGGWTHRQENSGKKPCLNSCHKSR